MQAAVGGKALTNSWRGVRNCWEPSVAVGSPNFNFVEDGRAWWSFEGKIGNRIVKECKRWGSAKSGRSSKAAHRRIEPVFKAIGPTNFSNQWNETRACLEGRRDPKIWKWEYQSIVQARWRNKESWTEDKRAQGAKQEVRFWEWKPSKRDRKSERENQRTGKRSSRISWWQGLAEPTPHEQAIWLPEHEWGAGQRDRHAAGYSGGVHWANWAREASPVRATSGGRETAERSTKWKRAAAQLPDEREE